MKLKIKVINDCVYDNQQLNDYYTSEIYIVGSMSINDTPCFYMVNYEW